MSFLVNSYLENLWTPVQLGSSLALWLDADDTSTITLNGTTVSEWRDKSGNGRTFSQSTPSLQPQFVVDANGMPSLELSGDRLQFNGTFMPASAYGVTVDNLLYLGTSAPYRILYAFLPNASVDDFYWWRSMYIGGTPTVSVNGGGSGVVNGQPYVFSTGLFDQSFSKSSMVIGAQNSGVYNWGGSIRELILTNSILSTADRQKLEGYLAWKWGLSSNLPSNHPYKTTPPTV